MCQYTTVSSQPNLLSTEHTTTITYCHPKHPSQCQTPNAVTVELTDAMVADPFTALLPVYLLEDVWLT